MLCMMPLVELCFLTASALSTDFARALAVGSFQLMLLLLRLVLLLLLLTLGQLSFNLAPPPQPFTVRLLLEYIS